MMALVAAVAGIEIPDSPLCAPVKGRKVIYITEDTDQFKRNLIALKLNFGTDLARLTKSIVLLPATRVAPKELLGLLGTVELHTTTTPEGIVLRSTVPTDHGAQAETLEVAAPVDGPSVYSGGASRARPARKRRLVKSSET